MDITVFRSFHDEESLNEIFAKSFRGCDIFVREQEINDFYNKVVENYRILSFKGYMPYAAINKFPGYSEKIESFIRNSRKQIEIEKSPFSKKDFEVRNNLGNIAIKAFSIGNLEYACKRLLERFKLSSEHIKKRDHNLVSQLIELHKKIKIKKF